MNSLRELTVVETERSVRLVPPPEKRGRMQSSLGTLAVTALMLAVFAGCAHRTTTMRRTSDTVRTDNGRQEVAAPPPVEETTTVIKRSNTRTEEGQQR